MGILLGALDQTVVGTAMPKIVGRLGGMKIYTWVFTAYMLASTASAPIFGKLSDMYGRRHLYLAGILLFMVSSVLCGLSRSMTALIVFRGLQGLSAGCMFAIAYALVADLFAFVERSKYQGIVGAVFGISSIFGPVLGGVITDRFDWNWVFFANIPVGLSAFVILALKLPSIPHKTKERVDYLGVLALLTASVPLLLALSLVGHTFTWSSRTNLALLSASLFAWTGFFLIEKRAKAPFIPLGLFHNPAFSLANIAAAVVSAGMFGVLVFMPLFLQVGAGLSTTRSGMLFTPMMVVQMIASIVTGLIIARTGRFKGLIVGAISLMAAGLLLISRIHGTTPLGLIVLEMLLFGLGLGVTFPVFNILNQAVVAPQRLGVATATLQFFRNIGSVIGVSIFGAILNHRIYQAISTELPTASGTGIAPTQLAMFANPRALTNPGVLSDFIHQVPNASLGLAETVLANLRHVVATGIGRIFLAAALALILTIPMVWLMAARWSDRRSSGP